MLSVTIIREMKIKTTMSYHTTPARMVIINKSTNTKCCQDIEKKEPSCTVDGNTDCSATVRKQYRVTSKI